MPNELPELSPEELARYSRHVLLPQIGVEGQRRLKAARVLLVGLGGLGSPAGLYLAAAGVGTLGLADFDTVARHNLQRQILHTDASVGSSKLASARERLLALNPMVELVEHPEGVTLENAVQLFSQYDIIVDGSDNFPTRYLVNDAAYFAQRTVVHGSIFQFEGQVSVFDSVSGGPCYRCLFPQMPEPGSVPNCEEAGVFGALCGMVGSIQALEAIQLITGIGDPLRGRLYAIDTLSMRGRTLKLKRDPACPLCGSQPCITHLEPERYQFDCKTSINDNNVGMENTKEIPMEISVQDAAAWLNSDKPPVLLDVREDFELDICKIEGCLHIPLGELGARWQNLPKGEPIVVYCHHGGRSLRATQALRHWGLEQATSMAGGIHVWAETVDNSLQTY